MTAAIPERETRYVKTEGGYVGYQVFGTGPLDLLFIPNWSQNLDVMWQEPSLARYLDRLASFARVIFFNNRGSGVSDPLPMAAAAIPSLDAWMDDIRAVLDASSARHAAILGDTEGGPVAILISATFPERFSSLVLVNSFARWKRADDYPIGMPPDAYAKLIDVYEGYWGQDADMLALTAPSMMADARFRSWFTTYQRLSIPPGYATAFYRWVTGLDVRHVLASVRAPTLVIHRSGNLHHRVAFGRYLAEHIPGSEYAELDGADSYPFHAGDFSELLDKIEQFLTGEIEKRNGQVGGIAVHIAARVMSRAQDGGVAVSSTVQSRISSQDQVSPLVRLEPISSRECPGNGPSMRSRRWSEPPTRTWAVPWPDRQDRQLAALRQRSHPYCGDMLQVSLWDQNYFSH